MSFAPSEAISPASGQPVPYRDPLMRGYTRRAGGLGAPSTGADVATGATMGAAVGSIVPILGTTIGSAVGAIVGFASSLLGGSGNGDLLKNVWDVVPFSLIRLGGGHGQWTDPITHQVLTDAQSDVRKSAVVASAIGAFNDQNNFWYDDVTQQHLTPADAWQRWLQKFGNVGFAQAYAMAPGAFTIFQPTTSGGDPVIHAPGAVAPALPASPTPGTMLVPQTASLVPAGLSTTTLAVIAIGLLVAGVMANRKRA